MGVEEDERKEKEKGGDMLDFDMQMLTLTADIATLRSNPISKRMHTAGLPGEWKMGKANAERTLDRALTLTKPYCSCTHLCPFH